MTYDTQQMAEDMAAKGWTKLDLATKAQVADMTVIRFLRGERQTAPTAKKLARALGYSVRRYLIAASALDRRARSDRRTGDRRTGEDRRSVEA